MNQISNTSGIPKEFDLTAECVGLTYRGEVVSIPSHICWIGDKMRLTITDNLGKSEIHQLYVAPCIKQDIFRLQISIYNSMTVEEDKDHGDFRSVELGRCKIETARSS